MSLAGYVWPTVKMWFPQDYNGTKGAEMVSDGVKFTGDGAEEVASPQEFTKWDEELDYVVLGDVISYTLRPDRIVNAAWRALKPGGLCVVVLPDPRFTDQSLSADGVKVLYNMEEFLEFCDFLGLEYSCIGKGYASPSYMWFVIMKRGSTELSNNIMSVEYDDIDYGIIVCCDTVDGDATKKLLADAGWKYNELVCEKYGPNLGARLDSAIECLLSRYIVILDGNVFPIDGGDRRLLEPLLDFSVGVTSRALVDNAIVPGAIAFRRAVYDEVTGFSDCTPGAELMDYGYAVAGAGYRIVEVKQVCIGKAKAEDIHAIRAVGAKRIRGFALFVIASWGDSGGNRVTRNCVKALIEDNWNVTVWCTGSEWGKKESEWHGAKLLTGNSVVLPVDVFDLVVATFWGTWERASRVKSKHYIGLVQSDEPRWDDHNKEAATKAFGIKKYKSVIVASYMESFKEKYGMDIVGRITNGVDSSRFYPENIFARKRRHVLGAVRKGGETWFDGSKEADELALRLSEKYDDFEYYVVGGGRQPPRNGVRYVPFDTYNEDKMRGFYNSIDVYAILSKIEGSSLTICEAWACGVPVVASRAAADPLFDVSEFEQLVADDGDQAVEIVSKLFDDDTFYALMSSIAYERAQELTWQNQRDEFIMIVRGVTGR